MTYCKVVDAIFGVTTLEKRHLAKCQEGAASVSSNFRDRLQRDAVFYGHLLRRLLDNNSRASEMLEFDHTNPAVFSLSYIDAIPTMVFVQCSGVIVVRFQRQILYTTFRNQALAFVDDGFCTTPPLLNATGNGRVQRDLVAVYSGYLTIPIQVDVARMPSPVAHALATTKRGAI